MRGSVPCGANCRHRAAVVAQATSHLRLISSLVDSDNTVGYCELMRILEPVVGAGSTSRHERGHTAYGQVLASFTRISLGGQAFKLKWRKDRPSSFSLAENRMQSIIPAIVIQRIWAEMRWLSFFPRLIDIVSTEPSLENSKGMAENCHAIDYSRRIEAFQRFGEDRLSVD